MTAWIVFALIGLGTWLMRASLIVVFAEANVPPVLERAFRYVGPSVMAAIAVPALLAPEGSIDLLQFRVPAGLAAGAVAWRTRNLLFTLIAGLAVYFGLDLLV